MILKKSILHNCGPHAHLEIDYVPGIMGLQGLNGSGKSSIVEGLFTAYSGELLTYEVKEDMLRRGSKDGYVSIECEAGDGPFKATRMLHKIGHMLTRPGGDPLVKKDDVNKYIQERIGLDPKLLADTAFIAQGQLWNILTGDRLARARSVSAMFGLDKAAQIYAASGAINARVISYPDRAGDIKELTEKRDAAEGSVKVLETELASLKAAVAGSEETLSMLEVAVELPDTESQQLAIASMEQELQALKDSLEAAEKQLAELPEQTTELQKCNALENLVSRYTRELRVIKAGKCLECEQANPFPENPDEKQQALIEATAERDAAVGLYNRNNRQRSTLSSQAVPVKVKILGMQEKLDALKAAPSIPAADKASYLEALEQFNGISERIADLENRRSQAQSILDSASDILARYEREQLKFTSCRTGLDLIADLKKLFHPEGLPKDALQRRLARYNELIARWLAMFKAPFAIRLTEEMVFVCDVHGYAGIGVGTGLSGGQKVLGAVAVMLARAEMLSFGCGIMVLDEPTAYLDKVNLPILVQVLQDADRHLRAEKLVLLVPTHELALEPVMSKVIKL